MAIRVRVLYFAIVRERLGRAEERIELAEGATTVADLMRAIEQKHGELAQATGSLRAAVNREYADADAVLCDGDEVAIIPPVSGG